MQVKAMRGNVSIVVVNGEKHVLLLAHIDSAGFLTPRICHRKGGCGRGLWTQFGRDPESIENRQAFFAGILNAGSWPVACGMGGLPVLKY